MKCISNSLGALAPHYPIENLCIPKQTLFIDIETTGLYAKSSSLYLIGCIYYNTQEQSPAWYSIQWFAENYEDEENVLRAFAEFAANYRYLIHFNGNQFDIPYLEKKMSQYHINCDLTRFEGIDIYRRIAPYKEFLHLPNCKQKTIEGFLHTDREDTYTGGELIDIYHEYVLTHDSEKEHFLLLHNAEDIKGMLDIIAALAIPDLIHEPVKVIKVHANYYNDIHQQKCPEIIMSLKLPTPLPTDISYSAESCYFIGSGDEGKLRVPIYEEEMKYFYSNYKDYYYLIYEDTAIHKSVGEFVDKDARIKATKETCYTKKDGLFLPQPTDIWDPEFKTSCKDKTGFFEVREDCFSDAEKLNRYIREIFSFLK